MMDEILQRRRLIDVCHQRLEKAGRRRAKALRRLIRRECQAAMKLFNAPQHDAPQRRRRANAAARQARREARVARRER